MSRSTLFSIVRQKNIATVLRVIHLEQKVSRAEISLTTGIARSTVSNVIDKLERLQIVEHTSDRRDPTRVGRPGALLRFNPRAFYALGIEINLFNSKAMLVGLDAGVIEKKDISIDGRANPNRVTDILAEIAEQVISKSGVDRERIIGLGVSFMGLIDHTKGMVVRSTSLPEWNRMSIVEGFQKRFAFPVYAENNANAMVVGEARFGVGQGKRNILGVTVEEGIGGGIVINKRLYAGSLGAAGEFGHMSVAQAGPICHCGNRGCLRTLASESAVEANAIRIAKTGTRTILRSKEDFEHLKITVQDVIEAARQGDSVCRDIISEAAGYLSVGLVNMVNVLSPEMIILSDGPLPTYEPFIEEVRRTVAESSYAGEMGAPEVVISALGENAVSIGAATVVMDRFLLTS